MLYVNGCVVQGPICMPRPMSPSEGPCFLWPFLPGFWVPQVSLKYYEAGVTGRSTALVAFSSRANRCSLSGSPSPSRVCKRRGRGVDQPTTTGGAEPRPCVPWTRLGDLSWRGASLGERGSSVWPGRSGFVLQRGPILGVRSIDKARNPFVEGYPWRGV